MKLPRHEFLHLAAGAAAAPALSSIAEAETYPTRPVRVITGFPAPSSSDSNLDLSQRLQYGNNSRSQRSSSGKLPMPNARSPDLGNLSRVCDVDDARAYLVLSNLQVEPILPLIPKGMGLIVSPSIDTALEVTVDDTFRSTRPCAYVIIATPKNETGGRKLAIDTNDRMTRR